MATPNWQAWCRSQRDITFDGGSLIVTLSSGRAQRVRVEERSDTLELSSVVVRSYPLAEIPSAELRAWRRNRALLSVGFRFDNKGRLVAEGWLPVAGLFAEEFLWQLRHVASESDLFEYQLTGVDRE